MFIDAKGRQCYKLGLHIHTNLSDGRVSPAEAARYYREAGYDAIAITDHWIYHEACEMEGLTVFSGCEYNLGQRDTSVDVMHIVGVGMSYEPELKRDAPRQTVIDAINAAGGLAILAHPFWSLNRPEEALALHGFAATEIYNTVSDVHESFRPYSGYFVDLLANAGGELPLIATDDVHYYDGNDECRSYIIVHAENGSPKALLDAVRRGDFYATQGPELSVERYGRHIIVECSPVEEILFISNASWVPNRTFRDSGRTRAEYILTDDDHWLRVEVRRGRDMAWSNIIRIK